MPLVLFVYESPKDLKFQKIYIFIFSLQNQVPQTAGSSAKSGKSEAEIKEEEELQLAIALSQSEAEEKEKQKLRSTSQILNKTGWCLLLILGFLSGKRARYMKWYFSLSKLF